MTIYDRHRQYKTKNSVSYLNGALLKFVHGWSDFDPERSYYRFELWAVCQSPNRGYEVGDRVQITRGFSLAINPVDVEVKIRDGGIILVRKDGSNQNEASINAADWKIYLQGEAVTK